MISNTTVQAVYNANGVTRAWTIPFVYGESENVHLRVSDGTVEIEIAASNFTVDSENQVVIYPKSTATPALAEGYKVAVYRETVITQEADFTNQGGVWPETVEAALDKLTEITQEHGEKLERCAKVTLTDDETPEEYSVRLWAAADAAVAAAGEAAANAGTAQQYAQQSGELYSQVLAAETAAVANIQTTKTTAISEIDAAADSTKDAAIADVQAEGARVTDSISGMATTVEEQTSAAIASAAAASQSEQNAKAYAEQAVPAATQAVASAAAAAASETAAAASETAAAESEAAAKAAETATTEAAQTATTKAAEAAASATAAANSATAAEGSATNAANSADEVEDAKEEIIALAGGKFGFRQPNTVYGLEDMAFFGLHMSIWYLECITAGTTGSGDLVITNPQIDEIVIDGTVTWQVRKQSSTGTGTATTPGLTKLYTGTGNNTDGTMTQAAISTALTGIGSNVSTLQTNVGTLQTNVGTLQTDVTTAQGDIDTLEGDVGAAQSNISSLQGNMTTAQGNISTLQNSMTTAQTDITNLQNALSMTYKAKGSVAFANLPATLTSSMLGWVYNVYDDFTTDSRFVEGAGSEYFAGENVAVVETTAEYVLTEDTEAVDGKTYYSDAQGTEVSPQPTAGDDISSAGYYEYHPAEYKFDVLSGYIDLSNYPRVVSFDSSTGTLTLSTL